MLGACWIGKATDTHSEYYCFFAATVITRTRLSITFVRTLPALSNGKSDGT